MFSVIRHCLLQIRDAFINVQLPEIEVQRKFPFRTVPAALWLSAGHVIAIDFERF